MMNPKQESEKPPKKYVPRPMTYNCVVCGAPAADVCHYGSTSCYSCRAFFRRIIVLGKELDKCTRNTDSCVIDQVNRANCKKCRFEKCIQNGMNPEKVGKNKTYRRKTLKSNEEGKESLASLKSLPSTGICSTGSEENSCDSQHDKTIRWCTTIENEDKPNDENNGQIFDISTLAENCVLDELEQTKSFEFPEMIIDQQANSMKNYPLASLTNPDLFLTLEEEFKIHELLAIKENLLDGCFKALGKNIPGFQKRLSSLLISRSQGFPLVASSEAILARQIIVSAVVCNDLFAGGKICKLLNYYSCFQNVPDSIKIETLRFSLAVTDLCSKAFFKVNSDKKYFIEQMKAAGRITPTLEQIIDQILPNKRYSLKSVDHYAPEIFNSPWASQPSDEDMFNQTMKTIGEIVKDDVKLGTLYTTLVTATPGHELSHEAKGNPALLQVQKEITLLIFRYLKNKLKNVEMASHILNTMLKLIGDLHICRDIHLFGRIQKT